VLKNDKLIICTTAAKDRCKLSEISCTTAHRIIVSGEELYTSEGQWARLLRVCILPLTLLHKMYGIVSLYFWINAVN